MLRKGCQEYNQIFTCKMCKAPREVRGKKKKESKRKRKNRDYKLKMQKEN